MSNKILFSGQAVKSEMIVLMLEKWGLHPEMREGDGSVACDPDSTSVERATRPFIPAGSTTGDSPVHLEKGNGRVARSTKPPAGEDCRDGCPPPTRPMDDLERETHVMVPESEYERAHEILFGESEFDRAEF